MTMMSEAKKIFDDIRTELFSVEDNAIERKINSIFEIEQLLKDEEYFYNRLVINQKKGVKFLELSNRDYDYKVDEYKNECIRIQSILAKLNSDYRRLVAKHFGNKYKVDRSPLQRRMMFDSMLETMPDGIVQISRWNKPIIDKDGKEVEIVKGEPLVDYSDPDDSATIDAYMAANPDKFPKQQSAYIDPENNDEFWKKVAPYEDLKGLYEEKLSYKRFIAKGESYDLGDGQILTVEDIKEEYRQVVEKIAVLNKKYFPDEYIEPAKFVKQERIELCAECGVGETAYLVLGDAGLIRVCSDCKNSGAISLQLFSNQCKKCNKIFDAVKFMRIKKGEVVCGACFKRKS